MRSQSRTLDEAAARLTCTSGIDEVGRRKILVYSLRGQRGPRIHGAGSCSDVVGCAIVAAGKQAVGVVTAVRIRFYSDVQSSAPDVDVDGVPRAHVHLIVV